MAEPLRITEVNITPNEVWAGGHFIISVKVEDPNTWLLDRTELFFTDKAGQYLLLPEKTQTHLVDSADKLLQDNTGVCLLAKLEE